MARSGRSLPAALVRSLRPAQWAKNLFVLAPLVFGKELDDPEAVVRAAAAFADTRRFLGACVAAGAWKTDSLGTEPPAPGFRLRR